MNILIENEIRLLHVGRTLFNLISNNPEVLDIKSDYQLNIVKEEKMGYPIYDKSTVIKSRWTPPVHTNSEREWLNWIKSNQPDLTNHVNNNSIFVHKQLPNNRRALGSFEPYTTGQFSRYPHLWKPVYYDDVIRDKKLKKLGI